MFYGVITYCLLADRHPLVLKSWLCQKDRCKPFHRPIKISTKIMPFINISWTFMVYSMTNKLYESYAIMSRSRNDTTLLFLKKSSYCHNILRLKFVLCMCIKNFNRHTRQLILCNNTVNSFKHIYGNL